MNGLTPDRKGFHSSFSILHSSFSIPHFPLGGFGFDGRSVYGCKRGGLFGRLSWFTFVNGRFTDVYDPVYFSVSYF
jgi:hypothetical protein